MNSQIVDEEIRKLYWDEGLNMKQVGDAVGCSAATICHRMKKAGMPVRKIHDYPPTEKQIAAWERNGHRVGNTPGNSERGRRNGLLNKGRRKRDYEFGGHEKKRTDGYIKVYVPDHPNATADGYVMKHILVMEREIGRFIQDDEVVHHINHIRDDNRIENLRLMKRHDHMSMHMKERNELRRKQNAQ